MTENEAIKVFKELLDVPCEMLVKYDSVATEEQKKALVRIRVSEDMAIHALSEIQQYRAIGTVEDLKTMKENGAFTGVELAQILAMQMELKKYQSIGTIEEFKALKEKNEPKKPRFYAHNYHCIECGNLVGNNEFEWQRFLYCDNCGTKLDWQ